MVHGVVTHHYGIHDLEPVFEALSVSPGHVRKNCSLILGLSIAIKQIEPSYSLSFTPKSDAIERATEMGPNETYDEGQLNPPEQPTTSAYPPEYLTILILTIITNIITNI